MNRLAAVLLSAVLGACASTPAPPAGAPTLFQDARFAPPSEPVDADAVFALSDAMQRYLRTDAARELRRDGKQRGLINALYRHGDLKLEYDATMTRNAAQAFEAKSGNCLSLVIMTAAFAKALDLDVTFQSVAIDETWSRGNDIAFLNGHVNITLSARTINARGPTYDENRMLTVDFLPAEDILGQRRRPIRFYWSR